MKFLLKIIIAITFLSVGALAQKPSPSASPPPPDGRDVVKISRELIRVDVTVTDAKGRIITDLKRDEIEIYENGQKQPVSEFQFVSDQRSIDASRDKVGATVPAPLPATNGTRPDQVRRTIALVADDLAIAFLDIPAVKRALKKFVDEQMVDGDLVAIIRTGGGIGVLQQFTTDKRQLYAAIDKITWNPLGKGGVGAFDPLEAKVTIDKPVPTPTPGDGDRTPEGIKKEFEDFRENVFTTGTLGATAYVVRGMEGLPGRKSIVLITSGFPLIERDAGGTMSTGRIWNSLQNLIDKANRASVVIYTLDSRGLMTGALTAGDNLQGRTLAEVGQGTLNRGQELVDSQQGLLYLAGATGGFAIINNNDLGLGIRKILDDQSYYLVGYEPDSETFDPKTRRFNDLVIKVTRPGTRVRYRSGFFGVASEDMPSTKETGNQRIMAALSSPFAANEISLRLNPLFGYDRKDGSYVRSLLHIDANDIAFSDRPDGNKQAVFDVIAIEMGNNGSIVDQVAKTFTMNITKKIYDIFLRTGFVYDFSFPVKKPGAYQFRVAVRDRGNDKVGSVNQFIEVPDLNMDRLTLSGIVLEDVDSKEWQRRNAGMPIDPVTENESSPLIDTALRQFKRGTVLNYGFDIYNARLDQDKKTSLTLKVRLLHDGKPVYDGAAQAVPSEPLADPRAKSIAASLALGSKMEIGDYVLEITVVDDRAKDKQKTATQYAQFEVVN